MILELVEKLQHLALNGYIIYSLVIISIYIYLALHVDDEYSPPKKLNFHYNQNPKVSIILPAYNEEKCIVASVRSATLQDYERKEIIVVSDGSTDNTVSLVINSFSLRENISAKRRLETLRKSSNLYTSPIRNVYTNGDIVLIDSDNGGKASALNLGILFSDSDWVLNVDADTVIVKNAISDTLRYLRPDSDAASCFIGVLNGNEVKDGIVTKHEVPKHFLARLQWLEYVRSFILWRVAHDKRNATVVLPGAFTFMKKDYAIKVGGYKHGYLSEDMEITMGLVNMGARMQFIPYFFAWTEVPENYSSLTKQRMRWYRGALESLVKYRGLLFNWWSDGEHSYNAYLSFFVLPFLWIAEVIGIWIELVGLISSLLLVYTGHANYELLFLSFMVVCSMYYLSVWLLLLFFKDRIDEGERYLKLWRVIPVLLYESICHHYINLYWMIRSHSEYYLRIKKGWNKFDRKGIK
jgi:cellulose synthase/poly-beta-1,6-N-acetylglucosamine synthase-like glycosyltransferase